MVSTIDYTKTFSDFTEKSYSHILELAKSKYAFSSFHQRPATRHVLWRHDIDFSMHRALKLAQLEYKTGVQSTYFLYPHSLFYNLMHRSIVDIVHQIIALGHDIGLHFDPTFYPDLSQDNFIEKVDFEKNLIKNVFNIEPVAISFHLFGVLKDAPPKDDLLCGMVNAYGREIFDNYGYVSDSNGIWRFRRLQDVLEEAKEDKLQVLTHPECWTPEVLSPRARIQRCINGYAAAMGKDYDSILESSGRPNIW